MFKKERVHLGPKSDEVIDATCERHEEDYLIDQRPHGFFVQQCRERRGPFPDFDYALSTCLWHAEMNSFYPNFFFSDLEGIERLVTQEEIDRVLRLQR